tara:strand:- start:209 stop:646 length:438 start_codon:yes stop_codon:yes gene_type:complete
MIIDCLNCRKKFNVDDSLIAKEGIQVQCGSCKHIWFYKHKPEIEVINDEDKDSNTEKKIKKIAKKTTNINGNFKNRINFQKKTKGNLLIKFFSYFLVFIISFIALIIVLDTLKIYLINIFPSIEIILLNLYETLKDIKLFIIDLT